jgi:hypothetical protein
VHRKHGRYGYYGGYRYYHGCGTDRERSRNRKTEGTEPGRGVLRPAEKPLSRMTRADEKPGHGQCATN